MGAASLETRRSDGTTSNLLGPGPKGRFMFDAEGNFAAQLMNPDRQDDNSAGYIANWGVYQVDEERQTFTLDFIGSAQLATIGLHNRSPRQLQRRRRQRRGLQHRPTRRRRDKRADVHHLGKAFSSRARLRAVPACYEHLLTHIRKDRA